MSARFIDESMHRDTCHAIRIAIQFASTVEPMSNDHPHQRPSHLYDHILCDGQCFLFVRSLTDDHPSDATDDRVRWDFLPRERPPRLWCISKNLWCRFNIRSQWWIMTMFCLDTFQVTGSNFFFQSVPTRLLFSFVG